MKDKIVSTSLGQFLKYGIRSMTVKKLVEPMSISTKTVYKYFKGKEELLKECLASLYGSYQDEFNLVIDSKKDPATKLFEIFRNSFEMDFVVHHSFFHDLNYYYPRLQNVVIGKYRKIYAQKFVALINDGIKQGYFLNSIRPELVLKVIELLYSNITRSKEYQGYKGDPELLFKNYVEMYIRGICTEKGMNKIDHYKTK